MVRLVKIAGALVILLGGCSTPQPTAVWRAHTHTTPDPITANLALGPSAEHNYIGELLARRSDWPAVEHGLRLDDVSQAFTLSYDDQSFYERDGGYFQSVGIASRTQTLVR